MEDDDTTETPIPSVEEEVHENEYDWDDPNCNTYDLDDPFLAPECGSDEEIGTIALPNGADQSEGILLLSPGSLSAAESRGRPARNRRKPCRYTPSPIRESTADQEGTFSYDRLADDDDGVSADDGDSQHSTEWCCTRVETPASSSSSSSDSDGEGGDEVDPLVSDGEVPVGKKRSRLDEGEST